MVLAEKTPRRGFFGRLFGAAAAAGFTLSGRSAVAAVQQPGPDDWLKEVKGTHRCLFDFPRHVNGFGLLHILNYLNTYATAYKTTPGQVGAVGTFYGAGGASSIPMGFNDAMWAKYGLGEYMGLKDAAGKPYVRNVFHKPTSADGHLLAQALQSPTFAMLGGAIPGLGIENLQKMGAKFIMCANALGLWTAELEARGKGKAPELDKELRANLLPGVTIVPAMVIAIEQAQGAGVAYNRQ